nr:MAG TPA: hypothetical protein [Caudoviricetes sp.]
MPYPPIIKASYNISDAINSQLCITKCFYFVFNLHYISQGIFLPVKKAPKL